MMEQAEKRTLTGIDFSRTSALLLPWTVDPWGHKRPPLSGEALSLSAELASDVYDMELEPWLDAGWRDATIQIDGEPNALPPNNPLSAAWCKYWIRTRLKPMSALGQVLGALRLRGNAPGNAAVMIHPAGNGRYVVAIGFMGTGGRFYDWFSNFRMTTQDGMHRGFLELARQLEENEEKIEFPETAEELGLEKLSLKNVLEDMKSPSSRFTLWLTGHSQGAATLQVYAHLKLRETGICPHNLIGYGFASPTVMTGQAVEDPSDYPLYHVLNTDDLVPHCGAQVHLGVCLRYQATEDLRKKCYNWKRDERSVQTRLAIRPIFYQMVDTPTCFIGGMAMLDTFGHVTGLELLKMLGLGGFLPLDRALEDKDAEEIVKGLNQRAAIAYKSVTGHDPDAAEIAEQSGAMQQVIDRFGLPAFMEAAKELMICPHYMVEHPEEGYIGTYFYIVINGKNSFQPFIWKAGEAPTRVYRKSIPCVMVARDAGSERAHRMRMQGRRRRLPFTHHDPRRSTSPHVSAKVVRTVKQKPAEQLGRFTIGRLLRRRNDEKSDET